MTALIDLLISPFIALRRFVEAAPLPKSPPSFSQLPAFLLPEREVVQEINRGTVRRTNATAGEESLSGRVRGFDISASGQKAQEIRDTTSKWHSVAIISDVATGGSDILVYVNNKTESKPVSVRPSETVVIDFKRPVIQRLYVQSADGTAVTGRVLGKY